MVNVWSPTALLVIIGMSLSYCPQVVDAGRGWRRCSAPSSEEAEAPPDEATVGDTRLPRSLAPLHYNLTVYPHLQPPWLLEGKLGLHMEVLEATDFITVNMVDIVTLNETLKVVEILSNQAVRNVTVLRQEFDQRRQMYTVVLADTLAPGSFCNMSLEYHGVINDLLAGFYRSQYTTLEGETRWLSTSQFSPTDARRAFPCFDEPAFKSTFDVTIVHHPAMIALSNMPVDTSVLRDHHSIPDELMDTNFVSTPLMSTYLVSFHVSDFIPRSTKFINGINFRVFSRSEVLSQAEYAHNFAPIVLEFLQGYLQKPFPLPKLDLVAVPDFKFTGMENWGMITFRETSMLLDEADFSPAQQLHVAHVIAHEIAHQWLGNLVTQEWWSELWLKEGLATFMGYIALDAIEPGWSVTEEFVGTFQQGVMPLDSFHTSHPVNQPADTAEQISQVFDRISYQKGACLLRMLYNFVGPSAFQEGLVSYLNQLEYSTANQDDLWRHMSMSGAATLPEGVSVKTIMDTWTNQKGYPVVNVTRTNESITLSQEQFLLDGCSSRAGWWVPLSLTTASDDTFGSRRQLYWMTDDPAELLVLDIATRPDEWVAVNLNAGGFFRVNYSPGDWELLSQLLQRRHRTVPPAHRAALIDDAFSLAWAGRLTYSVPLSVTEYLREEVHHVPWDTALSGFSYFYATFQQDKAFGYLQEYLLWLVTPWYERLGFEDTPSTPYPERSGREIAVGWACRLQHPDCVAKAQRLFENWISTVSTNLPGHARHTVLCQGVTSGGRMQWEAVWRRYLNTTDPAVNEAIISALGCTKEIWLLARYLDLTFSDGSGVRKQDAISAFSAVADNPVGRDLAWRYLKTHWTDVVEYLGSNHLGLSHLLSVSTRGLSSDISVRELEVFGRKQSGHLGAAELGLQQAKEAARLSASWWRDHYEIVTSWLKEHSDQLAETTASIAAAAAAADMPTNFK